MTSFSLKLKEFLRSQELLRETDKFATVETHLWILQNCSPKNIKEFQILRTYLDSTHHIRIYVRTYPQTSSSFMIVKDKTLNKWWVDREDFNDYTPEKAEQRFYARCYYYGKKFK